MNQQLTQQQIPKLESRIQRFQGLLFLGLIAMFLSEVMIWNTRTIAKVMWQKPLFGILMIFFAWGIYTFLITIIADIVYRYRVNNFVSLFLLGSIYGLFNEGIFAPHLLGHGNAGIAIIFLLFPTLSWHALLDGALTFYLFRAFTNGKIQITRNWLSGKEFGLLKMIKWFILI